MQPVVNAGMSPCPLVRISLSDARLGSSQRKHQLWLRLFACKRESATEGKKGPPIPTCDLLQEKKEKQEIIYSQMNAPFCDAQGLTARRFTGADGRSFCAYVFERKKQ